MSHIVRNALLAAASVAVVVSATVPASAGDWRRPHYRHYDGPVNRGDDALALGLFGLAAGAIAGAAIAGSSEPRYVERRYYSEPEAPVRYGPPADLSYGTEDYPPAPRQYGQRQYGLTPWSPEWYRYCADRYRSFNPRTGTYVGYDSQSHFCTAG